MSVHVFNKDFVSANQHITKGDPQKVSVKYRCVKKNLKNFPLNREKRIKTAMNRKGRIITIAYNRNKQMYFQAYMLKSVKAFKENESDRTGRMKGGWFSRLLNSPSYFLFIVAFFRFFGSLCERKCHYSAICKPRKKLLFGIGPRKVTSFTTK